MKHTKAHILASALVSLAGLSQARTPPDYDFDFATITNPGNAPYLGPGSTNGRGSVPYIYRIAKTEVTTTQWMEFINTFSTNPDAIRARPNTFLLGPGAWGARPDPDYIGFGRRWTYKRSQEQDGMLAVIGPSWREAALFCNWLSDGKTTSWTAVQNGAYDASTFTQNSDGTYNDQASHNPTANFYIPNYDEWFKAAHFDLNRYGQGKPGWWNYANSSDTVPIPGIPGIGDTSSGLSLPNFGEYQIPLRAYHDRLSPWGLWDTSGGASEWTESFHPDPNYRLFDGSHIGGEPYELDSIENLGGKTPQFFEGLRIAATIPTAPSATLFLVATTFANRRRRRTHRENNPILIHSVPCSRSIYIIASTGSRGTVAHNHLRTTLERHGLRDDCVRC